MTQGAAIPHNTETIRKLYCCGVWDIGLAQCYTPNYMALLSLTLPHNDSASKSCFQPCSREGTILMMASSREWSSWEITLSFLTEKSGKGADQAEGERKSLFSPVTYDLHHQHFNTTWIFQLRTQMSYHEQGVPCQWLSSSLPVLWVT